MSKKKSKPIEIKFEGLGMVTHFYLATQEAEIRELESEARPSEKLVRPVSKNKVGMVAHILSLPRERGRSIR
jgi:hypothetical protein